MDLLTKQYFESWMQKVMEQLGKQNELLLSMQTQKKEAPLSEGMRLFDNQDMCVLLQISKRTLQRYRSIGALSYKTLGKKTYYSEADVLNFLSEHVKDFQQNDIAFYKARIHNLFNK
ncbi:MAG: helix-turn-helix domain-containing protein [Parabacteroides sp.]|nr:helix-turn-helix domain-containing protein [Parabacteroides sp.]